MYEGSLDEAEASILEKMTKCPDPTMGEHQCENKYQCFEPCGKLGHDAKFVKVSNITVVPIRDEF